MKQVNEEQMRRRHALMLAYQEEIAPFTPTLEELREIWGEGVPIVKSHVYNIMQRMVGRGWVITRKSGGKRMHTVYYAVSAIDPE